jgi:hypothetical protein
MEQYFTSNQSTEQNPEFESQTSVQKAVKFSALLPPKYPAKREALITQTNVPEESSTHSSQINDTANLVWAKPIAHKRTLEPLRNGQDMVMSRPRQECPMTNCMLSV